MLSLFAIPMILQFFFLQFSRPIRSTFLMTHLHYFNHIFQSYNEAILHCHLFCLHNPEYIFSSLTFICLSRLIQMCSSASLFLLDLTSYSTLISYNYLTSRNRIDTRIYSFILLAASRDNTPSLRVPCIFQTTQICSSYTAYTLHDNYILTLSTLQQSYSSPKKDSEMLLLSGNYII